MTPDIINALFELIGGILLFTNVHRLIKDKSIAGVNIAPTAFYASWGYWNLYYYPHLNQTLSFFASIVIVVANTLWVIFAIIYKKRNKT